ncbi:MAG: bifunctional diguanylate cyclase/phosphodiesterase [Scytonema sp. PMC 1070.18]|nr:bifunctional diguanylate cyclase/phosphodiesterase [Scytonema sp. PMC 1070.18]
MTDLPNRAFMIKKLNQVVYRTKRQPNYSFALLLIDIDRFKIINDSLGYAVGDLFLRAIARRLEKCLHGKGTVVRLWGDEFAILLEHISDISVACHIAQLIHQKLCLPFYLNGQEVLTTASTGIVMGIGDQLSSSNNQAEDLLRNADIAMHRAKAQGGARYEVFDTAMYLHFQTLSQLENDLRRAIINNEFQVYYQPIVFLETHKIVGFEALVRWIHPQRGLLLPAEFLKLAEDTGLLIFIDWWVLRSACFHMRQLQEEFPTYPPLTLSVNFSSKQFTQPNLVEKIQQILQETGIKAHNLRLEMTESAMIKDSEAVSATFAQLKALGINLYIDDFGTGYSSLSYLHRFPIDTIKIDRSFMNSNNSHTEKLAIVRAIVTLAHTLNMDVIAEGVETVEQLSQMTEMQCEYGQGYLFSKPVNSHAMKALIAAQLPC